MPVRLTMSLGVWHSTSYRNVLISQWFLQGSGEFVSHCQPMPHFCLTLQLCCVFSAQKRDLCFAHIRYFSSSTGLPPSQTSRMLPSSWALPHTISQNHHFAFFPATVCWYLYTKADETICFVDFHACILLLQGTLRPTHNLTSLKAGWDSKHWFVALPSLISFYFPPFLSEVKFHMWPKLASNLTCSMRQPCIHNDSPCRDYRYSPLPLAESLVS